MKTTKLNVTLHTLLAAGALTLATGCSQLGMRGNSANDTKAETSATTSGSGSLAPRGSNDSSGTYGAPSNSQSTADTANTNSAGSTQSPTTSGSSDTNRTGGR